MIHYLESAGSGPRDEMRSRGFVWATRPSRRVPGDCSQPPGTARRWLDGFQGWDFGDFRYDPLFGHGHEPKKVDMTILVRENSSVLTTALDPCALKF